MTLTHGHIVVVWDLETTELSIYHQEPMEIGYAILRVVKKGKVSLKCERVGTTVSQLTLTNVLPGTEAMKTHGITPEILRETGVRLDGAIEKSQEQHRIGKGQGSNACLF